MPSNTITKSSNPYGVSPGVFMVQKWIATLKEKTGHSLDEWIALIKMHGPKEAKACREWLKVKHGLGQLRHVAGRACRRRRPRRGRSGNLFEDRRRICRRAIRRRKVRTAADL